jgi:hypothetical protein
LNGAQTRVWRLTEVSEQLRRFRSAISLHSHTCHSRECADFIPLYFQRIPVLNRIIAASLRRYQDRTGTAIDFRRVYWTPPVLPRMVFDSERLQIEQRLGLAALVSITDHDTIAAPLSLRERAGSDCVPISVEWSVPFAGNVFHLGVHGLPSVRAVEIMTELARYTAVPSPQMLPDLLTLLGSSAETLLVLNHPYFDFARLGQARHRASLDQFLSQVRPWIHALELGGLRPWREGQEVLRLANEHNLPVVAGGDRHGCHPNSVLNLSQAKTWGEFVAAVRANGKSDILALPACEEPVCFRELQTVADVARHYPGYPFGYREFTERIFVELDGYSRHPLSFYWSGGMPLWLRPVFGSLVALGNNPVRPMLRQILSMFADSDLATWPARAACRGQAINLQQEG